MPAPTPLHPRTSAHCVSYQWKEWAGYAAVCAYTPHSECEYFALRTSAGMLDVSPLHRLPFSRIDVFPEENRWQSSRSAGSHGIAAQTTL